MCQCETKAKWRSVDGDCWNCFIAKQNAKVRLDVRDVSVASSSGFFPYPTCSPVTHQNPPRILVAGRDY